MHRPRSFLCWRSNDNKNIRGYIADFAGSGAVLTDLCGAGISVVLVLLMRYVQMLGEENGIIASAGLSRKLRRCKFLGLRLLWQSCKFFMIFAVCLQEGLVT